MTIFKIVFTFDVFLVDVSTKKYGSVGRFTVFGTYVFKSKL
jgi:hypothetical protein